jgi:hypothetical protein
MKPPSVPLRLGTEDFVRDALVEFWPDDPGRPLCVYHYF